MQDSTKLLGFDARRALNFNSSRALSIPLNRELGFDIDRELGFDLDRPLPFGRRGVLFRGYACPICGASVLVDATECAECGVQFVASAQEQKAKAALPSKPLSQKARERQPIRPPQQAVRKQPPVHNPDIPQRAAQPQRARSFQCPVCNALVPTGSASCPKCTVQFVFDTPPPPEDALVLCPICDLKVSTKTDYCTRCGEPLSPGAIAKHRRELEKMRGKRAQTEESGYRKVGEPQKKEPTSNTITWEEYMERKKGGGYR